MADRVSFPVPGCVVECMQANRPAVHWVLEISGDTARLLSPSRKESKLNVSRLLPWYGPAHPAEKSREEIEKILKTHETEREKLAGEINILEIWNAVKDDLPRADAFFLASLVWNDPDADHVAAVGQAALACKTHFKFTPPDFEIYDEETAIRRVAEQEAAKEREALAAVGSEFFRSLWACHTKARGPLRESERPPEELAKTCARMLRDRIADPECQELAELWRLLTKSLPEDTHLALHLATAWGLVDRHHNFWLDRAGYAPDEAWADAFKDDIAALAEKVRAASDASSDTAGDTAGDMAGNMPGDMAGGTAQGPGGAPFVSVDPAGTADVDDAFSVRKNEDGSFSVSLAFACPSRFWPFRSGFDKAVLRRASSLYLPEGDHHMMPRETGASLFSLFEHETRPATVLDFRLSETGEILEFAPRLSWVRLEANLTLPGVQAVLDGPSATVNVTARQIVSAAPFAAMLQEAREITEILQKKRIRQGAVITERPEAEVTLEGAGTGDAASHETFPDTCLNTGPNTGPNIGLAGDCELSVSVRHAPETPSAQTLVGEFMILANAALAAWARDRNVPLIFRTQDVALPKEFAGVWTEPQDIARIVKLLPPSTLELVPRQHAGLGVSIYAPLTSPIRRYTDLINTAQIVSYLETGTPRLSEEELSQLLPVITASHDAVSQAQRFRPRYWKLLFYKQMGDKMWWDAVVTEENDAFVTLLLPLTQIMVRAKRRTIGEKAYPGERVKVRLGKVDPLRNEIRVLAAMET